jgi:hypothetical protein
VVTPLRRVATLSLWTVQEPELNALIVLLFYSLFLVKYAVDGLRILPNSAKLIPEALSAIVLLVVIGRLLSGSRVRLDWRYAIFFALLLFTLFFGFMAQSVEAGPIVSGLRLYLKALPFFFLPAVYPFTERQLKTLFFSLVPLVCMQIPIAFFQKYVAFRGLWHTGDMITGTTTASGPLSLVMLCGIAALVVLYLRSLVRFIPFLIGAGLLFAPTTINETKITIVVLPFVILLPMLFMPAGKRTIKKIAPILAVGAACAVGFLAVYAYFTQFDASGESIGTFFESGAYEKYLYNKGNTNTSRELARLDTVIFAVDYLKRDPLRLAFGVGAGNASMSPLNGFEGKYATYSRAMGIEQTQVTYFLWEIGLVGLLTYLLLYAISFRDAVFLARRDGPFSALGQYWATMLVVWGIGLTYMSIFTVYEMTYFFWFVSGLVGSKAWDLRRAESEAHRAARRTTAESMRGTATVGAA